MNIIIGLVITLGCILGGYMAMGGHLDVLMQPFELVIIGGAAIGGFIMSNPIKTIKDTGKALGEAFKHAVPKERQYLDTLVPIRFDHPAHVIPPPLKVCPDAQSSDHLLNVGFERQHAGVIKMVIMVMGNQ